MSIEKIARDELREKIAKALWVRRTSGPQAEMWDEYLVWYKDGASDPNSCVHHSSIAMALADADAVLALPHVSASYRAGAEDMREAAAGAVSTFIESLQEGLMTDADITDADRRAMRHQITALELAGEAIRALPPLPLKESTDV